MCNFSEGVERRGKILGVVECMLVDGKSDEEIIARLMSMFALKEAVAKDYLLEATKKPTAVS